MWKWVHVHDARTLNHGHVPIHIHTACISTTEAGANPLHFVVFTSLSIRADRFSVQFASAGAEWMWKWVHVHDARTLNHGHVPIHIHTAWKSATGNRSNPLHFVVFTSISIRADRFSVQFASARAE